MKTGDIQVLEAKYYLGIKQPARKLRFEAAVGPGVKGVQPAEQLPGCGGRGRRGAGRVSLTLFIQHLLLPDPYREMRIDFGQAIPL